jgi:hypothetical protein
VLEQVVEALYNGVVVLKGKSELRAFEEVLSVLQSLDILLNLQPCLLRTSDGELKATITSAQTSKPIVDEDPTEPEVTPEVNDENFVEDDPVDDIDVSML